MELKQDGRAHSLLKDVLFDMRIRPFKVSKYCIGTCMTRPEVKQNRFKKKLRRIEKLKNDTRLRNTRRWVNDSRPEVPRPESKRDKQTIKQQYEPTTNQPAGLRP